MFYEPCNIGPKWALRMLASLMHDWIRKIRFLSKRCLHEVVLPMEESWWAHVLKKFVCKFLGRFALVTSDHDYRFLKSFIG
jgi:hypothetical protein